MEGINCELVDPRPQASSVLDAARFCLEQGWVPIPVRRATEEPLHWDWRCNRPTEDDLEELFAGDCGIAVINGKPSGGLVCVDLVCEEAAVLGSIMLPFTEVVTGDERRPRTRLWYVCPEMDATDFTDPVTGERYVTVHGNGSISLIGPSVGPSGSPHDALDDCPAEVEAAELSDSLEKISNAVAYLRGHRFTGSPVKAAGGGGRIGSDRDLPDLERYPVRDRIMRARSYLDKLPPEHRFDAMDVVVLRAAYAVVWGFAVPITATHELLVDFLLRKFVNARWEQGADDDWLREVVLDAVAIRHPKPRGWMLTADAPEPRPEVIS